MLNKEDSKPSSSIKKIISMARVEIAIKRWKKNTDQKAQDKINKHLSELGRDGVDDLNDDSINKIQSENIGELESIFADLDLKSREHQEEFESRLSLIIKKIRKLDGGSGSDFISHLNGKLNRAKTEIENDNKSLPIKRSAYYVIAVVSTTICLGLLLCRMLLLVGHKTPIASDLDKTILGLAGVFLPLAITSFFKAVFTDKELQRIVTVIGEIEDVINVGEDVKMHINA